jgi:hypothetical protein
MNATTKPTHFVNTFRTPPCSQGLAAERSATWCEPDCLWEPPVVFDEEAEAAYKVWQESLSYLVEDIERFEAAF